MVTKSSCSVPSSLMRAQEAFERLLDQLPLLLDIAPQLAQRDAGIIGQRAVRQNLAAQRRRELAQIGDRATRAPPGAETAPAASSNAERALGGQIQQPRQLEDLGRLPASRLRCAAAPPRAPDRRSARSARESPRRATPAAAATPRADNRSPRRYRPAPLRSRARSDPGATRRQLRAAQRAAHVAAQQRPQRFEFKNGFGVH